MNKWTEKGGFFAQFNETGTTNLKSPWKSGTDAASAFETSVKTTMENVVSNISSNVKAASGELAQLVKDIQDTAIIASDIKVGTDGGNQSTGTGKSALDAVVTGAVTGAKKAVEAYKIDAVPERPTFKKVGTNWLNTEHTGVNIGSKTYSASEFNRLQIEGKDGIYFPYTAFGKKDRYVKKGEGYSVTRSGSNYKIDFHTFKPVYTKHAKGTTSTPRDEWAITDEPKFGDELVLVPGNDGNLSFMRKGTGIVPADLTQKLFELAQIPTSDLMRKNITAIVPDIKKTDISNAFSFDSLVHVDHCDQSTLKELEKMVDNKINDFGKQMNYSLKKFTR